MNNFTYIIGYRHNPERIINLRRTLEWIYGLEGIDILIVEQDKSSKLSNLNIACEHIFIENSGPYNRSWAFNVGIKHSKTPFVIFGDSDLIMNYNDFIDSLKQIEKYECVSPYKSVLDLTSDESNRSYVDILNVNRPGRGENDNQKINLCGGITIFRKDAILRIGGWCELFEGWGAEDDALALIATKKLSCVEMPYKCYHLYHSKQPIIPELYTKSISILNQFKDMDDEKINRYVQENLNRIGKKNKYSL